MHTPCSSHPPARASLADPLASAPCAGHMHAGGAGARPRSRDVAAGSRAALAARTHAATRLGHSLPLTLQGHCPRSSRARAPSAARAASHPDGGASRPSLSSHRSRRPAPRPSRVAHPATRAAHAVQAILRRSIVPHRAAYSARHARRAREQRGSATARRLERPRAVAPRSHLAHPLPRGRERSLYIYALRRHSPAAATHTGTRSREQHPGADFGDHGGSVFPSPTAIS